MLLVFAGLNGSGKSTITNYVGRIGVYTNADDVVASLGMSNEDAARFVEDKFSIFPNDLWSEGKIMNLII